MVLILSLVAVPCGKYIVPESYELHISQSEENESPVYTLSLQSTRGKVETVTDRSVVQRKIVVESVDTQKNIKTKNIYRLLDGTSVAAVNGVTQSVLKNDSTVLVPHTNQQYRPQESAAVSEVHFGNDFVRLNKRQPSVSHLLHAVPTVGDKYATYEDVSRKAAISKSPTANHTNAPSAYADMSFSSQQIREIPYRVVLPEDFSQETPELDLVSEVVRVTFNANQYLREIGFALVPTGITIYRNTSRFSSALQNRDPYTMLSKGVEEKRALPPSESGVLLAVFSKTFFSRAAGLSYLSTACENPLYSVVFASTLGSKSNYEISLSTVLAHEVGHFLGMSHDDIFYTKGFSLMAARQVTMPFGFSDISKSEQQQYSAMNAPGGACLLPSASRTDTDNDGVSDVQEVRRGTSPEDAGSYYVPLRGTSYLQWNTNLGQETVGEFINVEDTPIGLKLLFRNSRGEQIAQRTITLGAKQQQDILFTSLIGSHKNSYGILEVHSENTYIAKGTTYSFSNTFENFTFVHQQDAFQGMSGMTQFLPINFAVPNTMTKGSRVTHWLSIVNTGMHDSVFRVSVYSPQGGFRYERFFAIPAQGRFDYEVRPDDSLDTHGTVIVEQLTKGSGYSYHAFVQRYYYERSGRLASSILLDGAMPSGVQKSLVYSPGIRNGSRNSLVQDAWIEVANALLISNTILVRAFDKQGKVVFERSHELLPYGQVHVQFPSLIDEYVLHIEAAHPDSVYGTAIQYLNDQGRISNEQLSFQEENLVEKYLNINTFVNTTSQFVLTNSTRAQGVLRCQTEVAGRELRYEGALSGASFEIRDVRDLFPEFPKQHYARVYCALTNIEGSPLPSSMRVDRFVEQKRRIQTLSR